MRPRLFLRTTEFLWQEGHTAHADEAGAMEETLRMLDVYETFARDVAALPAIKGEKTAGERFPGAEHTYSIEAMMRDGRALQAGTSHYLGTNFADAYDITFTNQENQREACHTTSWGVSTRLIGGLIMAHGDDRGLVLPQKVAPVQVVVVPIFRDVAGREGVSDYIEEWRQQLAAAGIRVRVDWAEERPGEKFNRWELKGVPLRLEVGPRDVEARQVVLVDRLSGEKRPVSVSGLAERLRDELQGFQAGLLRRARDFMEEHTYEVSTLAELVAHFRERTGFVWAPWCGSAECEARVKEETGGVTTRNFDPDEKPSGSCLVCGRPATRRVVFARSY
jgi:prolyl-tRNA synthetase